MHEDLAIRPLSGRGDLDLFRSISYVLNKELEGDLDAGRRRLDWLWVALRFARAGYATFERQLDMTWS